MAEFHEFFAQSHDRQMKEVYSLIKSQIPLTFFEKCMRIIFWNTFRGKIERSLDIDKMIQNVLANRYRTYESVYNQTEHLRKSEENSWNIEKKVLFSANLSIVCQKYCIDPATLMKEFTLEQYMWLQDGVIFNVNEQEWKKWQAENQMALVDKEEVKKRAAATRKAFEELEKKQQSQK